jgi:arylsulfatase A-like enzyme
MMNRRRFLASAPALMGLTAKGADARTNVLLIAIDDLNVSLGCYGHPQVKSPGIDRLAARSVRFDRNYCQFPLCAPSRTSFLSGRRPETTRVWTLTTPTRRYMQDVTMLPELFRKNGYYAANVGKVFHTGPEHYDARSWDLHLEESGKKPSDSEIISMHVMPKPRNHTMEWEKLRTPDSGTPDGMVAAKASEEIRKCVAGRRPFFVGAGFRRPHAPYAAPARYFDLYDPNTIVLPEVPSGYAASVLPAARYELDQQVPPTAEQTRQYRAAYYACVSFVDAQIGRLLDTLDDLKMWDNTAVVLTCDHGYHLGEHGMWHKMTLFEESLRVPLIVHAPGAKGRGRTCQGLVESVDIYPTVAEICGLKPPAGYEGISLLPLLQDPSRPGKQAVFSMVNRTRDRSQMTRNVEYLGKTVRTRQWRYTEWDEGRRGVELYDEQGDPGELRNLAGEAKHAGAQAEMRSLLRRGGMAAHG